MGQILGLGITHYPPLCYKGNMSSRIKLLLADPLLPEHLRTPAGWHPTMREQWSTDEGAAHSDKHRADLIHHFRKARAELDAFRPDWVLIWGDDQYENFKEDVIPPFCVLAYDSIEHRPWAEAKWPNAWDEAKDTTFTYKGHRPAAKALVGSLLQEGFDVSYAYRPLHHPLGHAFLYTLLFLDYDRQGFPYPVIPFQVNCYGRRVISQYGGAGTLANMSIEERMDPPSPAPWRCFDLGRATARVLASSPWRVALIASSSWSHAFLTPKRHLLYPDVESDRAMYETLRAGDYEAWRKTSLATIEDAGQQEMLNWMCLAGAMAELGRRPSETEFLETYIFNAPKCFGVWKA